MRHYVFKDWKKNTYFLKHIVSCIEGKKDKETIEHTLDQLRIMIKEEEEKNRNSTMSKYGSLGSI